MNEYKLVSSEKRASRFDGIKKYIIPVAAAAVVAVGICTAAFIGGNEDDIVTENITQTDVVAEEAPEAVVLSRDSDFSGEEYAGYLKITVAADGAEQDVVAAPGSTVAEALESAGIELGEDDVVTPDADSTIINGSVVSVTRVEYVRDVHVRSYKYQTEYRQDETLPEGSEEILVDGEDGEIVIETLAKIVDGKAADVEVLSKEITRPAVNRVVLKGTLEVNTYNYTASGEEEDEGTSVVNVPAETAVSEEAEADEYESAPISLEEAAAEAEDINTAAETEAVVTEPAVQAEEDVQEEAAVWETEAAETTAAAEETGVDPESVERVSRFEIPEWLKLDENGVPVEYTDTFTGKSCAYTAEPGALMSTGKTVFQGYVAVDPKLIPYGSELYIIADDGSVYGYAIAADTGYSVRVGDIVVDLFMDEYDDCINWGARNVTIYLLK